MLAPTHATPLNRLARLGPSLGKWALPERPQDVLVEPEALSRSRRCQRHGLEYTIRTVVENLQVLTGDCRSRRSQFLPLRPCSAVGSASRSSWRSACPAGSARSLDFLRRSRRKTRRELRLKCLVLRGQEARRVSLQTGNSDIYLVHRLLEAGLCLSQPIYGLRPGPIFNNGHRPARYRVWLQTPRWRLCLLARRRVQPVYETSALVESDPASNRHTVQEVLGQVVPDVEAIRGGIAESVELQSSWCTCRTPL